jgi:hypothetical protein
MYACGLLGGRAERDVLIEDPAAELIPGAEVSVVRYLVGPDDWRRDAAKN